MVQICARNTEMRAQDHAWVCDINMYICHLYPLLNLEFQLWHAFPKKWQWLFDTLYYVSFCSLLDACFMDLWKFYLQKAVEGFLQQCHVTWNDRADNGHLHEHGKPTSLGGLFDAPGYKIMQSNISFENWWFLPSQCHQVRPAYGGGSYGFIKVCRYNNMWWM